MTEIASRYGLALYSIAEDRQQINELQLEAKELRKILLENRDFIVLLGNSFLSFEEREKIIDKTISAFDKDIVSLIKVLVRNNRANHIMDTLDAFNSYCNHARGVEEGLVYSVVPLDEQTISKLQKKISQLEKVEVEFSQAQQNLSLTPSVRWPKTLNALPLVKSTSLKSWVVMLVG